ncbi:SseB family protein [Frateuria terrea]|uniref:SseB protein N-terminal domain-containing protein n=1 Tax=Frateuria terrea TaxID=529704 RepID=A0A1H6UES7_9GAMM|nr:SseB family protein [Frateuria terrea]SEI89174.1 SseB protein N-terminal domain-containing protein [Frateuria terrea]SFP37295.1 SseB protein N-terminal domain-containing protein [Frateuria terrea]
MTPTLQDFAEAAKRSAAAEQQFLTALLDATVYVHVPATPPPSGRLQLLQFTRPDNGQMVLPFFSDQAKAQLAGLGQVGVQALPARQLLELTRGATLMLNPTDEGYVLYPEEIAALLAGQPIGSFTTEHTTEDERVGIATPSVPTEALRTVLAAYCATEPLITAGYLVQVHRGSNLEEASLLVDLVVPQAAAERVTRACIAAVQPVVFSLALPLLLTCHDLEEPLCYEGSACFYRAE